MADVTAERRLVKSHPELWAEVSELERLAEHLGELGEIRITKVEPETTVAWEGEQISGTVSLEQAGWGTKVTLSATVPEPVAPEPLAPAPPVAVAPPVEPEPKPGPITPPAEPEPEPEPFPLPDPEPSEEPEPVGEPERIGFWARLFRRRRPAAPEPPEEPAVVDAVTEPEAAAAVVEPEPEPAAAVEPEPEPVPEPEAATATAPDPDRVQAILDGTLDALGQAHHRPFSRG